MIRNRCKICNMGIETTTDICKRDEINLFILDSVIDEYLNSPDGVVNQDIASAMYDLASLHLNDDYLSNLKRFGEFFIKKFVINYSTRNVSSRADSINFYESEFRENRYFTVDQALIIFQQSQIIKLENDEIDPGKLLDRLINLRVNGTSLNSDIFKSSINEFWGLFSVVTTKVMVQKRLNNEISIFPRTSLSILNILSQIILNSLNNNSPAFKNINKTDLISSLSKISNSARDPLIAKLSGISIEGNSYIIEDIDDVNGIYSVKPEIEKFLEYIYTLYRTREIERER